MAQPTIAIYVDWDGDGDFGEPYEEITTAVYAINWERGKSSAFASYASGFIELYVRDANGNYSPDNPSSTIRSTIANFEAGADVDQTLNATTQQRLGQSFQLTSGALVDRVLLRLQRTGAPGGSLAVQIWDDTSALPLAILDSTAAVSESVTVSDIGTAYEWRAFLFAIPVLLQASTTYHLVLVGTGYTFSAGNQVDWASSASGYASGAPSKYDGTSWSAIAGQDLKFRVSRNDVILGRQVWVTETLSGTVYPQFHGRVRVVNPHSSRLAQTAYLYATDEIQEWRQREVRRAIAQNTDLDEAIDNIARGTMGYTADQVSIGESAASNDSAMSVRWWFQQPHASALEVVEQLAEASAGSIYMKAAASPDYKKFVYRSRFADWVDAAVLDEDWTTQWQDNESEQQIEYRIDDSEQTVANRIVVTASPRKVGPANSEVWTYGNLPETWGGSEARTIWADLSDPCTAIVTPESVTDYTAGFAVSITNTYGSMVELSVTAPVAGGSLDLLRLRGTPVELEAAVTFVAEDSASQTQYGIRELRISSIYRQSANDARQLAQTLLERHRMGYAQPRVTRLAAGASAATSLWQSLLQRDLGDRIALTLPTGIGGSGSRSVQYHIEGLWHEISVVAGSNTVGVQKCTYRLRKALGAGDLFTLDTGPGLDQGKLAP